MICFAAVAAKPAANGVFIFDAATVAFPNATSMTLSGLPNSTAYVQYPPSVSGGTFAKVRLFSVQRPTKGSKCETLPPGSARHGKSQCCKLAYISRATLDSHRIRKSHMCKLLCMPVDAIAIGGYGVHTSMH